MESDIYEAMAAGADLADQLALIGRRISFSLNEDLGVAITLHGAIGSIPLQGSQLCELIAAVSTRDGSEGEAPGPYRDLRGAGAKIGS